MLRYSFFVNNCKRCSKFQESLLFNKYLTIFDDETKVNTKHYTVAELSFDTKQKTQLKNILITQ